MMAANQPHNPDGPHPLIARAIEICGTQKRLARKAGMSPAQVSRMLSRIRSITANAAVGIHQATDGQVPKHTLRPDLFDPPADPKPSGS